MQAPLAKRPLWWSLWALVNDQDVLEVGTGLDDKERVPLVGKKREGGRKEAGARKLLAPDVGWGLG